MVRGTIPFTLSPVLAEEIAELPSRQHSLRSQAERPSLPSATPGVPLALHTELFTEKQELVTESLLLPTTMRPIVTEKYGLMTGRKMSHLKQSLGVHFPALHRANLRSPFGSLKKAKMSNKQQGKQPVKNLSPGDNLAVHGSDLSTSVEPNEQANKEKIPFPISDLQDHLAAAPAASRFLATVRSEMQDPSSLSDKGKARWLRENYTSFKALPVQSGVTQSLASKNTSTPKEITTQHPPLGIVLDNTPSRQSIDLSGIGGARSLSARTHSVRASIASISDHISEGSTMMDDASTVASSPRISWQE